jgi:hypothetical protein
VRDVYSTTTRKAALVFLSPVLVVLLSIFVLAVQVGAGLYFGVQQQGALGWPWS